MSFQALYVGTLYDDCYLSAITLFNQQLNYAN